MLCKSYRHGIGGLLAALAVSAYACSASAQDYQRYRPQTLPVPQAPVQVEAKPLPPVEGSDTVLVERMNALIVLDRPEKVQPLEAFADYSGLHYDFDESRSLVRSHGFRQIVESYLGGPITLRQLNEMARDIILLYRRNGQPVVDVVIPEQKITAGTVQIVVVEARIGQVRVDGDCWFDPCMLADQIECTQPGDRLYERKLRSDLFWLNRSPFRRVEVDLEPGAKQGTTDVVFEVRDAAPWRAYLGYEDTGVPTLGIDRVYAGFIWGDVFRRDGQFSYQYTADTHFDRLQAHAVTYQRAWNRDWSWQTYGAVSDVASFAVPLNQEGQSWIVGGAIMRNFNYGPYLHNFLTFGSEFKSTNNNLEFGGLPVTNGRADLFQVNLGYDHIRRFNDYEYWLFANDLYVGPNGGLSAFNDAAGFSSIRPNTRPGYVYNRAKFEGVVGLPFDWQLLGRVTGQVASQRLLYSEMLGYGGYDSVRGYDQRVFNADYGYVTNLELGPRPWMWGEVRNRKQLRVYGFVDFGEGYVRQEVPGEVGQQWMSSVGSGMRFAYSDRLSVRFDYGYGLNDVPGARVDHRAHVGVVYLFGPRP